MDWFDHAIESQGWITDAEAVHLYRLAKGCYKGCIVEIGSYKGKSTMFLAAGSKAGRFAKVYAIDPHDGGPFHLKETDALTETDVYVNTYEEFCNNLEASGLAEHVEAIVKRAEDVVGNWIGDIGFLFIDGDHYYENVLQDLLLWTPHVVKGGIVAIHDAIRCGIHVAHPGPARVAREYLIEGKLFYSHNIIDTMVTAVKV